MLVGHAHADVTAAAQARIALGTTFFANNRWGIELAREIVAAVPCAEQVRFVSTGSEADLYAMRAARAFTQAGQDPQIRGRLPWHERLFADEPGAKATRQFSPPSPGFGRHSAEPARRNPRGAVQRSRQRAKHRARASRRARGRHRRAVSADHPAASGLSRRAAPGHRRKRRSADFRRGGDRVSPRLWRCPGILRRRSRFMHARQGDRRRFSVGGDCRPGRDHGPFQPRCGRRRRLSHADRHIVGQSGRRRGGPRHARNPASAWCLRRPVRDRARTDGQRSTIC